MLHCWNNQHMHAEKSIFESCYVIRDFNCNYTFPIDFAPNRIPFGKKNLWKSFEITNRINQTNLETIFLWKSLESISREIKKTISLWKSLEKKNAVRTDFFIWKNLENIRRRKKNSFPSEVFKILRQKKFFLWKTLEYIKRRKDQKQKKKIQHLEKSGKDQTQKEKNSFFGNVLKNPQLVGSLRV